MITDKAYTGILDAQFRQLLDDVSAFIKRPMPTLSNEVYAYVERNLSYQDDLSNLQANLDFHAAELVAKMKKRELVVRDNSRLDGLKTKEERELACHNDAAWADLDRQVLNYRILSRRADQLAWILKSSYNFVSK